MRCPHCSKELVDTAAFICPHCGGLLDPMEGEVQRIRWFSIGCLSFVYAGSFALWALSGVASRGTALTGMSLAVVCALALALKYDAKVLAALGLAGGFLTPLLLDTGSTNPAALYAAMLALNLAALGMAQLRGWPLLAKAAFACTWVIVAATYIPMAPGPELTLRLWAVHAFLVVFVAWPMIEDLRGIDTIRNRNAFLPLAAAMIALGVAYPLIERNHGLIWCAALTLAYSALYLAAAAALFLLGKRRRSCVWLLTLTSAVNLVLTVIIALSIE
jgi:uncharacterized membrane protein